MAWRDKIKSRVQLAYESLGNMPIAKAIGGAITNPTPQGVGESIYNLGRDVSSNLESSFGSGSTPEEMAINFSPVGAMTAYHGTPHKIVGGFDKAKIGTGEGAQAFGHGFYATESKGIAKDYAKMDAPASIPPRRFINGVEVMPGTPEYHATTLLVTSGKSVKSVIKEVKGWIENARPGENIEGYKKTLATLENIPSKAAVKEKKPLGRIYTLDIPEPDVMLDWDKPLSQQPIKVKTALYNIYGEDFIKSKNTLTGEQFYKDRVEHWGTKEMEDVSDNLYRGGVKGITYPAGTISGAKTDAKNFVIFDPEDIKITAEEFLDK